MTDFELTKRRGGRPRGTVQVMTREGLFEQALNIAARRGYVLAVDNGRVTLARDGVERPYPTLGKAMLALMLGKVTP